MRAAHAHDLWILKDKLLFKKITRRVNEEQDAMDMTAKSNVWALWTEQTIEKRKKKAELDQRERFKYILQYSTRGQRSTMEKEEIRRFIAKEMTCIPKTITFSEMDTLCNEVDWIPYIGRSILFLQGDFGNVYYMIAQGRVGLYLEPSKDREMAIAREFGQLRAQPYHGTDEELAALGNNIINLPVRQSLLFDICSPCLFDCMHILFFSLSFRKEQGLVNSRFLPRPTKFDPARV